MLQPVMTAATRPRKKRVVRWQRALTTITPAVGRRIGSTDGTNAVYVASGDVVGFGKGSQIAGNFYQRWDGSQLELVVRIIMDKPSTAYTTTAYVLYGDANWSLAYNGALAKWVWRAGGQQITPNAAAWAQGDALVFSCAVDTKRVIDAANYGRLSINDVATFGMTTQPAASVPATFYLGGGGVGTLLSGIYEGATIMRRVLYDGTYGVQPSDGDYAADELAAIYNAGNFRDPAKVVSAEDIVFQLAPKASSGALTTTDEGWGFPHSSNLLTDGHMLTTFASGGWAAQGTPSDGPKDIADAANKIYAGGYQFTSDAADEGIVQTLDVAEGADLLVIAWMHSDADGQPALVLYDTDNAAELGRVESGAAGTYDDPDTPWRAEITTEAPAGCTHVEVRAINLAASGTVYVHQVLALPNLLSNPSFEAAGAGGADIWAGWSEFAGDGALADEAALMRSGAHAAKVTTGATIVSARARATQNVTTLAQRRYRYGAFGRGDGTNLPIVGVVDITNGLWAVTERSAGALAGYGRHAMTFMTPTGCVSVRIHLYAAPVASAIAYFDDVSLLLMDTVSLTVTPAAASSTINGADTAVRVLSGQLGRSAGEVEVAVTPTWSAANAARGQTRETLLYLYIDANNYLRVSRTANTLTLTYNAQGGGAQTDTFDLTGLWAAGVRRRMRLAYQPAGAMVVLDGAIVCSIAAACVFSAAFTSIYFGSETSGVNNADALFE